MPPRTPRPLKCSIGRRVGTDGGLSARYPMFKEYIPILSCKRDVTVHLKRLNVSSSSVSSERELILLRSGHFDEQGHGMTVCLKHRDVLGFRKGKCDRVYRRKYLKMMRWNKLVSVGSGEVHGYCLFTY